VFTRRAYVPLRTKLRTAILLAARGLIGRPPP
jgi:hypothetical protein